MNDIYGKMLFFFAVASFPAWFLLRAGLSTRRESRQRSEQERARATGVIADYVLRRFRTGRSGSEPYWAPVVEFTAEGRRIRAEYENRMDRDRFPVGRETEILYDISDPSRFHLAEDPVFTDPGSGAIRFSLIWIAGSALLTLALAVFVGGLSL